MTDWALAEVLAVTGVSSHRWIGAAARWPKFSVDTALYFVYVMAYVLYELTFHSPSFLSFLSPFYIVRFRYTEAWAFEHKVVVRAMSSPLLYDRT